METPLGISRSQPVATEASQELMATALSEKILQRRGRRELPQRAQSGNDNLSPTALRVRYGRENENQDSQ